MPAYKKDEGARGTKPPEVEGAAGNKVWYAYPDKIRASAAARLEFKGCEMKALVLMGNVIEREGKISKERVVEIFKRQAEIAHERVSELRIGYILDHRFVRSGRLVRIEETPDGEVVSDSKAIVDKILDLHGIMSEERRCAIKLREMFDMTKEESIDKARRHSIGRINAIIALKKIMPDASFNGLRLLIKNSSLEDCHGINKIVERPAELKEFLGRTHANLTDFLGRLMPGVSEEALENLVSKTPLNELAENIRALSKRPDLATFSDDDLAAFKLEGKKRMVREESEQRQETVKMLAEMMPKIPISKIEAVARAVHPMRLSRNAEIMDEYGVELAEGDLKALELSSPEFKKFCEEFALRKGITDTLHREMPAVPLEAIKELVNRAPIRVQKNLQILKERGVHIADIGGLEPLSLDQSSFVEFFEEKIISQYVKRILERETSIPEESIAAFVQDTRFDASKVLERIESLKDAGMLKECTNLSMLMTTDDFKKPIIETEVLKARLLNKKRFYEIVGTFPENEKEAFMKIGQLLEKRVVTCDEMWKVFKRFVKIDDELLRDREERIDTAMRKKKAELGHSLSEEQISRIRREVVESDEYPARMKMNGRVNRLVGGRTLGIFSEMKRVSAPEEKNQRE